MAPCGIIVSTPSATLAPLRRQHPWGKDDVNVGPKALETRTLELLDSLSQHYSLYDALLCSTYSSSSDDGYGPPPEMDNIKRAGHGPTTTEVCHTKSQTRLEHCQHVHHPHAGIRHGCVAVHLATSTRDLLVPSATILETIRTADIASYIGRFLGRKMDHRHTPGLVVSTSWGGKQRGEALWGTTTFAASPPLLAKDDFRTSNNSTDHANKPDPSNHHATAPPSALRPSPSYDMPNMHTRPIGHDSDMLHLPSLCLSPTTTIKPPSTESRWYPSVDSKWANNDTEPYDFNFDLLDVPMPLIALLLLGLLFGLLGSAVLYFVNFPPEFLLHTRRRQDDQGRGRYEAFSSGSIGYEDASTPFELPPSAISTSGELEGTALHRRMKARSGQGRTSPLPSQTLSPTGHSPLLRSSSLLSTTSTSPSPLLDNPHAQSTGERTHQFYQPALPPHGARTSAVSHSRQPQALNLDVMMRRPHPQPESYPETLPRPRTSEEWIAARAAFEANANADDFDTEAQTPLATPQKGKGFKAYPPTAMSLPSSPRGTGIGRRISGNVARSSAGWLQNIDGAVDRVVERVVRFTSDDGGEEGLLLPVKTN